MSAEKINQPRRALIGMVVQINVCQPRDNVHFLRFVSAVNGSLSEVESVGLGPGDHQQRPGRNEVHEGV